MKKFIPVLFAVVSSCHQPIVQEQRGIAPSDNNSNNNAFLNVQMSNFTEIDSSGILMFPLTMSESERNDDGSQLYKSMPQNSYWNIIFLDTRTNGCHLLSNKKMLIRGYDYKYDTDAKIELNENQKYIFYTIITEDLNGDKIFNHKDATYLFATDRYGKNLIQLSPSGYDLVNWKYIKASDKVISTARKDSNHDKKFDEGDEVVAFEFDLTKNPNPVEIFPDSLKNNLKILYDRDWKKVK